MENILSLIWKRATRVNIRLIFMMSALLLSGILSAQLPENVPLKLRVGIYNVGHFNQGRLGGFQGDGNWAKAALENWREWISKQSLDIFAVNEWNMFFDKDSTMNAQEELLKPFYSNVYFGAHNRWIYNGIATNYRLTNLRQKRWSGDYYALIGDLRIGKKVITVMSTHIPWQKGEHVPALDGILEEMKRYEYVIVLGDMNASDQEQLRFKENGFNIANGGSQGWFATAAGNNRVAGRREGPNTNIDNIITSKNIKIMRVSAPYTGLNDLDHLPVLADLIISW